MAAFFTACGGEASQEAGPGGQPSGESTPLEIALRHFAQVPDTVLRREGACPFECCIYGPWRAEGVIPLLTQPLPGEAGADTLAAGQDFVANSGFVQILGPGIIVTLDTVGDDLAQPRFLPGDTMVLLDYLGEGHWNLWADGEVVATPGFWGAEVADPRGAYYGDYRKEWWVHARTQEGLDGWFRADTTYRFSGADACGGPA